MGSVSELFSVRKARKELEVREKELVSEVIAEFGSVFDADPKKKIDVGDHILSRSSGTNVRVDRELLIGVSMDIIDASTKYTTSSTGSSKADYG